jgi:hypothetical protein
MSVILYIVLQLTEDQIAMWLVATSTSWKIYRNHQPNFFVGHCVLPEAFQQPQLALAYEYIPAADPHL